MPLAIADWNLAFIYVVLVFGRIKILTDRYGFKLTAHNEVKKKEKKIEKRTTDRNECHLKIIAEKRHIHRTA